jgi:hypothetical protein
MQVYPTCGKCKEKYFLRDVAQFGFSVLPLADGTDSVQAAIHREMASAVIHGAQSSCTLACNPVTLTQQWVIDSTPEYLRVALILFNDNDKNTARVHIEEILDLTQYMGFQENPKPVQYKLTSAIYHIGGGKNSGHYTAGVTSGRGQPLGFRPIPSENRPSFLQWVCNDEHITQWVHPAGVANKMTINPANHSTKNSVVGNYNAYVLWYVRHTPAKKVPAKKIPVKRSPAKKAPPKKVPAPGPVDNTIIAERLVARKRAARGEGADMAGSSTKRTRRA